MAKNLTDDAFPDYPLISVANHATKFRIDDQHTALFCRDPFFGPPCTEMTGDGLYHPFFFVVNPASVEVYKNAWMNDISSIGSQSTYPHMVWTPYLSYHVEGIAHTSTHLFVSTVDDLYRVPIGEDLQQVDPERISFGGVPCEDEYLNHVGDIAAIGRLTRAETGDTLSAVDNPRVLKPWSMPEPLLPIAIEAATKSDEDKLSQALSRLAAEDPSLRIEHNAETKQLVIWTMGEAHTDVVPRGAHGSSAPRRLLPVRSASVKSAATARTRSTSGARRSPSG